MECQCGRDRIRYYNLTNTMKDTDTVKRLLSEYESQKKNTLYQAVMEIIVNANKEKFGEVKKMCNALLELMKDDLDERERIGEARGRKIGEEQGKEIGERQGESRVNRLVVELSSRGRTNDLIKSATDGDYQKKLFAEFGL